jgi:formylmethanofuran dehydrogenase subunit B
MTRLKAYFAGIPYKLNNKTEKHYQTIFYVLFKLMGQFIEVEQDSAIGRADEIIVTADAVYAFEFKLTEKATAEDAIKQIDKRGYLTPYIASNKKLMKLGVEFSKTERGLKRWVIEEKKD